MKCPNGLQKSHSLQRHTKASVTCRVICRSQLHSLTGNTSRGTFLSSLLNPAEQRTFQSWWNFGRKNGNEKNRLANVNRAADALFTMTFKFDIKKRGGQMWSIVIHRNDARDVLIWTFSLCLCCYWIGVNFQDTTRVANLPDVRLRILKRKHYPCSFAYFSNPHMNFLYFDLSNSEDHSVSNVAHWMSKLVQFIFLHSVP